MPSRGRQLRQGAARRHERGMTLLELMLTTVVTLIMMGSVMTFLIYNARMGRGSQQLSDIQRGGRSALSIMGERIEIAGMGLPRAFAIQSFNPADGCGTQTLAVASMDYEREWTVASTTGTATSGTLTLLSATPSPLKPDGTDNDIAFSPGQWLFLFQNSGTGGHGMVRVGSDRNAGSTGVIVDTTNYSSAQTTLDLSSSSVLSLSTAGAPTVMMRVNVSEFGVDCTDANRPFLYWDDNGTRVPIASIVDTRQLAADNDALGALANDVVGLRFRFYVDTDADGLPDDQDGNSVIDTSDFLTNPSDLSQVVAIEIQVRLRADEIDPLTGEIRFQDFSQTVFMGNVNTQSDTYIFLRNSAI